METFLDAAVGRNSEMVFGMGFGMEFSADPTNSVIFPLVAAVVSLIIAPISSSWYWEGFRGSTVLNSMRHRAEAPVQRGKIMGELGGPPMSIVTAGKTGSFPARTHV